jgi:type I restriction enzyme, S subunit
VTDSARLPPGWVVTTLEELVDQARPICYGILMPKEHVPDGVPYVKVKDMKTGRLNLAALSRTAPAIAAAYRRASLIAGDLLLAIRGTYGRVVDVPPELQGGNITQDTARVALVPQLDRRFVMLQLQVEEAQQYFRRVSRGVAVKGVNLSDVKVTPIRLPRQEVQHARGQRRG